MKTNVDSFCVGILTFDMPPCGYIPLHLLAMLWAVAFCASQFAPGVLDSLPKKAQPAPIEADLPYLRCPVCEELSKALYRIVEAKLEGQPPKRVARSRLESSANLGGEDEAVENVMLEICNPEKPNGSWIRFLDVVKAGRKLDLRHMPIGKCRRECRTIEKVCGQLMDSLDDEDPAEVLLAAVKSKSGAPAFSQRMCIKLSKVCKKGQVPLWPEGKARKNEEFIAMTEAEITDERKSLEAQQMKTEGGNPIQSYRLQDFDIEGLTKVKADPRDELKDEL